MDDLLATIQSANPSVSAAAPVAPPVAAPVSPTVAPAPLPLRNNNPGAVSPGGAVAAYPDLQTGMAAADKTLTGYSSDPKANTIGGAITKWVGSPPNAPAYIADVTKRLGIPANTPFDATNPVQRQALTTAIFLHENGPSAVFASRHGQQSPSQPAPTTPGQSNSGASPQADTGPMSDLFSTLQQGAPKATPTPAPAATTSPAGPQQPQVGALKQFGQSAAGLADTLLSAPGAAAGAADYAVRRAFQQSPAQAQAASNQDFGGAVHPVGNALGVTNTPGYQNEASQRIQQAVGGVVGKGVNAVAGATGAAPQDVANMAGSLSMLVPGMAHMATNAAAPIVRNAAGGLSEAAEAGAQPVSGVAGRGSVGAAGTSFAQQAVAEGVPDAITARIAAAEQAGTLNPTAAGRHIEAGSLPVPVELTAGQASGDVHLLSSELNSRGKNPELANRFNVQNGQIADNLNVLRDQVSPNVNVPSGAPTGQALVDAYKEMDGPIRDQIAVQYQHAVGLDGTSALVDATGEMMHFEQQIGATRFNALPSRVQQIFLDAKNNRVTLPPQFDQPNGASRPMNARDIMDIDQTLSGAIAEAKSPTVQHDIGQLRDSILNSPIDPSAGPEAIAAFKTAQASARARFQAMDSDPAYKAASNDVVPHGEPSPLADQFVQKYIAGGKTANVQSMIQNLSNDPINSELVASGLMDHIRAQAGIDLRTGSGNISQAGLNKAIQNLGDKTRIVLGPDASQTVEKLGNVARYTQEQPRGSYVNNSNTFVASAANAAKSAAEGAANVAAHGIPVGTWTREALARRSNAKAVAQSLEPGAGLSAVPLNQLLKNAKGNP